MFALEAEALTAEAVIPSGAEFSALATRPILVAGDAPLPAVILLEMTARGVGVAAVAEPSALVAADALRADVAVTRAHTASTAMVLMQATETAWAEVAQNLPRYAHPSRNLRIDAGGGSLVRNPRAEGATLGVVGAGGAMPTNWVLTASGLTTEILAVGTDGGVPYIRIRASGTASSTQFVVEFDAPAAAVAAPSQPWVGHVFFRRVAEPTPPASYNLRLLGRTAASAAVAGNNFAQTITPTSDLVRQEHAITLTSAATLARITQGFRAVLVTSSTYDFTVDLGAPDLEQTATLGKPPLLPVAGGAAATSRAADVPIWTPATFPRRGCILLRGTYDAAAGASVLGLMQIDGGADTNRIVARIIAGGLQPEALVVSGGATAATLTPAGSFVAGAPFTALLAWSPGGVRFGTSAGGVVSAAVAMPAGLTRAVLGHADAAGTLPMGGALTAQFYDAWPSVTEATAFLAS